MDMGEWLPQETRSYLARVSEEVDRSTPRQIARRIKKFYGRHDEWREKSCINLIASENIMSPTVKLLFGSDLGYRVCDGPVGKKALPAGGGAKYLEEIEAYVIEIARRLFNVGYVEHRTHSGTQACQAVQYALTNPGDTIMSQALSDGGNAANRDMGPPRFYRLKIVDLPYNGKEMNVDLSKFEEVANRTKPKLIILGAMIMLFPHPLKEIIQVAKAIDSKVAYDGAHVGALIAGGRFEDPLREGCDALVVNTHKIMGGPTGAMILMNDTETARKVSEATFLGLVQTPYCNRLAALAMSLTEMLAFRHRYAEQIIRNAKTLAKTLDSGGLNVIGREKGYTESHQVLLDVKEFGGGYVAEKTLTEANIVTNKISLPWDSRAEEHGGSAFVTGLRLGVPEVTRRGMKEKEMVQVGNFICRILVDKEDPEAVRKEVSNFMKKYQRVRYCFD